MLGSVRFRVAVGLAFPIGLSAVMGWHAAGRERLAASRSIPPPAALSSPVPRPRAVEPLPDRQVAGRRSTGGAEPSVESLYVWPVLAPVSSPFGPRDGRNHNGIDLAANQGDAIRAARSGKVILAGPVTGYGNTVIVEHPDRTRTLYAHCSALLVKAGQQVAQGAVIARVGSTGMSTGPHLHFEIIVNERPRDPLLYLSKEGRR